MKASPAPRFGWDPCVNAAILSIPQSCWSPKFPLLHHRYSQISFFKHRCWHRMLFASWRTRFFSSSRNTTSPSRLPLNGLPIDAIDTRKGFLSSPVRSTLSFFGTALLAGLSFHLLTLIITGGFTISERGVSVLEDWEMREPPLSTVVSVAGGACLPSSLALTSASPPPPTPTTQLVDTASFTTTTEEATPTPSEGTTKQDDPELEELRAMVSKTKGYFARDWSLYLGWNNVGLLSLAPFRWMTKT